MAVSLTLHADLAHDQRRHLPQPDIEREVLAEAGSYGRQLGRIGDALIVLLKRVNLEGLAEDEAEAKAIRELKVTLETVANIKERHGVKHVLRPSWQ